MFTLRVDVSDSDVVRAYITTLRKEQHISQEAVAGAIPMALRTYKAWEGGSTKDIKVPLAIRAIKFLGGTVEHLWEMDIATEASAAQLARDWARLTPEQRVQASQFEAKFRRVIALGEQDPVKLEQVIERLRADAQADPAVLDLVLVWLDGRRSR